MAKTSFLLPLMFLLLFANYGAIFSVNSSNATTDQSALLELKSHISHDPYNLLATNWSTSISVCDWIGITGGSRHHRVTALNLSSMDFRGTIPSQLGSLSFLASLDFRHNSFHGSLPTELANLHQLKYLNFGRVPSPPPSLQLYDVSENNLAGEFPASLCNLSALSVLNLNNNSLGGTIPKCIGNFSSSLLEIDLRNNNFHGPIPCSLGELSELESLDLSSNNLHGRIPTELKNLGFLAVLNLSQNNLTGHIPQGKQF
ncbi:Detected protein of unknown function [Hibiscus syriacus]|uniref:Leucine-rich repeat-containing N-terminal plant-type domain-containing protein n=1 Tax=Hibiscus syriacus TaxID=106335 RepID=A0A6A2ZIZ7_HIBSY|nr:Detected protein of unknown function [Hibiscus syriacus]